MSVVNPELQATVTKEYLAYSAADIFAHSLDMYLTATYLPEYIAGYVENILRTVIRTTEVLLEDAGNYEARGEFAWAATNALNFTTNCGVENNRFDTHFIEHTMSAEYNIAHWCRIIHCSSSLDEMANESIARTFCSFCKRNIQ